MEDVNIWELNKVYIRPNELFLKEINFLIRKNFKSKEKFYKRLSYPKVPCATFKNYLKYSYYEGNFYAPLNMFIRVCELLNVSKFELQKNIHSYKSAKGYNIIENPILPIRITPLFDMIFAHNIADGTVIDPKRKRQIYFGYRQFDKYLRLAYVKKLESIFGKIKFKEEYFNESTRPYCPAVLSYLFFDYYNLNSKSFLSKTARLPKKLLNKNEDYLLAVLLAFIIDEGNIDSSMIVVKLKNIKLTEDLYLICRKLSYDSTFNYKEEYGNLYIKRKGMKKLFEDYKKFIKKYPEANMGKIHRKIEEGFKIYDRQIYKAKGNREIMLKMLNFEDLTVNQLAMRINMTRQGVRNHIHILEKENKIFRNGLIGRNNIVYSAGGDR